VAYYPLDGNAVASIGNNGTVEGGTSPVADRFGNAGGALSLSGSVANYINVGAIPSQSGTMTFSGWAYLLDLDADYALASNVGESGSRQFLLWMDKDDGGKGYNVDVYRGSGTYARTGTNSANASATVWQHVAFTFDGTTARMFVDGKQVSENSGGTGDMQNPVDNFRIGIGRSTDGTYDKPFKGHVDDVGIFNTAENLATIAAIHGLSVFSGLNLDDPSIATVAGLSTLGDEVAGVGANNHIWRYVDGLTGDTGTVGGDVSDLSAFIVLGSGGYGVQLVPEPGTMLLLVCAGACGLLLVRRRRLC